MKDRSSSDEAKRSRRRWIGFGELIGVLAVAISAVGLWKNWNAHEKPTTVVEQRQPIPLTLRGKSEDEGRKMQISPVENSHALQSLTIKVPDARSLIEVGSDGELAADDVQGAMSKDTDRGKGTHRLSVHVDVRYVEAGADRRATGNYVLAYRWDGGGLFGGRSLRLIALSRA